MVCEIYSDYLGGYVNILPYIAAKGLKWQRSDIDAGEDVTRTMTGELRRNRVATKVRLDVTCRPLKSGEANLILNLILPVFVRVRYYDPQDGRVVEKEMYANNNPASFAVIGKDGTEWWDGIEFPLIEK